MLRRVLGKTTGAPLVPNAGSVYALQRRSFAEVFVPSQMPIVKKKWSAIDIIKITTETMRNIAAGKLPACERHLRAVRPFASAITPFFELPKGLPDAEWKKMLHIGCGTERGLCGGIAGNVPKEIADTIKKNRGKEHVTSIYGKKGMTKISSMVPKIIPKLNIAFGNVKSKDPNFGFICETIDRLIKDHPDFDIARVYYNAYVNNAVFRLEHIDVYRLEFCEKIAPSQIMAYELEGDEGAILQDLQEFKIACAVYQGLAENYASEQGSRLMSMDGAVKACKEKAVEYEMIYQKLRKTKITNELTVLAAGMMCINEGE